MNTQDIRKYIMDLNIGSDEEVYTLKDELLRDLKKDLASIPQTIEILEELMVEINERLGQTQDETVAEALERKLNLVEATGEALELDGYAPEPEEDSDVTRSVLIADETEQTSSEPGIVVPVAIDPSEEAALAEAKTKNAGKDKDKKSAADSDDSKKLEKEAEELIKEKQKEQKEREKEQKRLEKEQQKNDSDDKDDDKDKDKDKDKDGNDTALSAGTMDQKLAEALLQYNLGDYVKARDSLKQLSNSKTLSKNDLGYARFWYGYMLSGGQGGDKNEDAARFWMNEAAKCDNVLALMSVGKIYAEMRPTDHANNVEITTQALRYFEKADKAEPGGYDPAKEKYIEICEEKPIYFAAKLRACRYCDELADKKTDAYEKKQYEDRKEKIKKNYKSNKAAHFSAGTLAIADGKDIVVIIGAVFTVIADIFIFMNMINKGEALPQIIKFNSKVTGTINAFFGPLATEFLNFISTSYHRDIMVQIHGSLLFGLCSLAVGRLLMSVEDFNIRGKVAGIVSEISDIATILTVLGSLTFWMVPWGSFPNLIGNLFVSLVMIAIVIIAHFIMKPIRNM